MLAQGQEAWHPKRLIAGELPPRNPGWLPFSIQVEPYVEELGFSPVNVDALLRGVAFTIVPLLVLVLRL